MRGTYTTALTLALLTCFAWAHGGGHRGPPNSRVPPGLRPPSDEPPSTPPTPGGDPPAPGPPGEPPPSSPTPSTPPPGQPSGRPRPNPRTGRGTRAAGSWRAWWEYNREYVLGLRRRIRESGRGVVTGPTPARADPMAGRRDEVREALRSILRDPRAHEKLASACFIALGRVGTANDVDLFLETIRSNAHEEARASALLGLGLLPPLEDAAQREKVRRHIEMQMAAGPKRSRKAWEMSFVTAGLRARHDRRLAMSLARHCAGRVEDSIQGAVLVYACGVSRDDALLAEVMLAARGGKLGGTRLHDIGRSHAVAALGLLRSPVAVDLLARLLKSRRAGIETRRGAALALGRLLREADLPEDRIEAARRVLLRAMSKGSDGPLRGYAAIALGGAKQPLGLDELMHAVDRGGQQELKHYASLALGLAARRLEGAELREVRRFLLTEFRKAKDIELASALSVALGLAGVQEARKELRARVGRKSLPAPVRGAACQALGMLRDRSPETGDLLVAALHQGQPRLVEGATIGLGLIGRRGVARELVKGLEGSSNGILQGSFTMALGNLGQAGAIDPLLELLRDKRKKRVLRDLAAVALGMLGDPRDDDVLFEMDAYFNYFATTALTYELLTIF